MKKIKLLKTIGCIALVATPVIVAPIIMSTSCTTTDPTPTDPTKVTSIEGIKLMQGNAIISDKYNIGTAIYETAEVESIDATAEIVLSIEIYFYVNNNPTPVKYTEVKDSISFDFVCRSCLDGTEFPNVFKIEGNNIVILNDQVNESVKSSTANKFCDFVETTPPKGYFGFYSSSQTLISYGVNGDSEVQTYILSFQKKV